MSVSHSPLSKYSVCVCCCDVHAAVGGDGDGDDDMGPMMMDPPHDVFKIDDYDNDDACGHLHFIFYSFRPCFHSKLLMLY
eukprot:13525117-Ditylum_brightwellii.AAC.1